MAKWADGARSEDTATLKNYIVSYIPLNPAVTPIIPPLPENKKEGRGLNHPMIARLLLPRISSEELDNVGPNAAPAL